MFHPYYTLVEYVVEHYNIAKRVVLPLLCYLMKNTLLRRIIACTSNNCKRTLRILWIVNSHNIILIKKVKNIKQLLLLLRITLHFLLLHLLILHLNRRVRQVKMLNSIICYSIVTKVIVRFYQIIIVI